MARILNAIRFFFLSLGLLFFAPVKSEAASFDIEYQHEGQSFALPANEKNGAIYADIVTIANIHGKVPTLSRGIFYIEFTGHTLAIHPKKSKWSIRDKTKKDAPWETHNFQGTVMYSSDTLLVPLADLPDLFKKTFTYHYQKKTLRPTLAVAAMDLKDVRMITISHKRMNNQLWISVEELARALNLATHSSQGQKYLIVLPDLTILELQTNKRTIFKKNIPWIQLNDPVILVGGTPYITLNSVNPIFGINVEWNARRKMLVLPIQYQRMQEPEKPKEHTIHYLGTTAKPVRFSIEELRTYYQEPIPIYSTDPFDIYDSVRDLYSYNTIRKKGPVENHIGTQGLFELSGTSYRTPFEGRGSFEKTGDRTSLISGSVRAGFPGLMVEGGREYMTFGGLSNQFNLVDQVSLSHSNDTYGDDEVNPRVSHKITYGTHDIFVFQSTSVFTQTVEFKQEFLMGSVTTDWSHSSQTKSYFKIEQFMFMNNPKRISSEFIDREFLEEIFPDDPLIVDPEEEEKLIKTLLSDEHYTTMMHLNFQSQNRLELDAILGYSHYQDELKEKEAVNDTNWRLRARVGKPQNRIEASYEKVGKNYRSMGNPSKYQDRDIVRVNPYLTLFPFWRVYGEYRRENSKYFARQGYPLSTNTYMYAVNSFSPKGNLINFRASEYTQSLYGRRLAGRGDYSRYLGRGSIDVGYEQSAQWDSLKKRFKTSQLYKGGFSILTENAKFSLGQDYTVNDYVQSDIRRFEWETNVRYDYKEWKSLLQYGRKPKIYFEEDIIYTGFIRVGRKITKDHALNIITSRTSVRSNLSRPEAWRVGFEYVRDF